jgi:AraC-like DNA-binding protein
MAARPSLCADRSDVLTSIRDAARIDQTMKNLSGSIRRDDLSDVLQAVRFRGVVFCRSELSAPWGFSVLGREFASFHIVTRGRCCLDVDGLDDRFWLSAGDVVILPTGHAHTVRDSPSSPATRLEELVAGGGIDARGTLRTGGGGAGTVLVCGGFQWEDGATSPIVASLPPIIHLHGRTPGVDTWLRLTLAFLSEEADSGRPGAEIAVTRLADLLFIEVLRTYFSAPGTPNVGLAAALRGPRIAAAIVAIQRRPERRWEVGSLARQVAMSRTAFATRFKALVGESPFSYVSRCRMSKATGLLRSRDVTIAQVAERSGYDSEASFGRAFRRWLGTSPAAFRGNPEKAPRSRRSPSRELGGRSTLSKTGR